MAIAVAEKVRAKLGDYDYGVFHVSGLEAGANNLSAGAFGMTKAFVTSAGAATQATLSATGTAMGTISTAENTSIGGNIVITAITAGDEFIVEVMGW